MRGARARAARGTAWVAAGALGLIGAASATSAAHAAESSWTLDCTWDGVTGAPDVKGAAVHVALSAPETIDPGTVADITAAFTDGAVVALPQLPDAAEITTYKGVTLSFAVTGGSGVERLDLIGPGVATALPASGALTEAGKLTGQLPIPAAGSRTLTLTKLTVALAAKSGEAVGLVCVPSSPAGPALTVKAEAKQASSASATPSPGTTVLQQNVGAGLGATGTTAPGTTTPATTPGSGTTGAGTNGNASGGNLAATGSKDSGITAFAMLAGTALLGALAVLLTTPARRRRAAHQAAHHSSERS